MILEGVVSNVAAFGAFVDIGVHQDGLIHISALADRFVKDPRDIVKAGDIVKVKVLEIDVPRKRIALTCRLHEETTPETPAANNRTGNERGRPNPVAKKVKATPTDNALAQAFARARLK